MNIGLTLFGQTISFFIFVWFCVKFVWPPFMTAMQERQKRIADGLQAADRAKRDLQLAQAKAGDQLKESRAQAAELLEEANRRASRLIEAAKEEAKEEAAKIMAHAKADVDHQINAAREALRADVSRLALAGAEKILQAEIDATKHAKLVDDLAAKL